MQALVQDRLVVVQALVQIGYGLEPVLVERQWLQRPVQ